MADTRKDKRAPISLKVRFKSATLDEFIEQYSVDISRGGIFIKSKTPMSIGTLLKFEFRLKDESRLIHGVGRVIWKREEDGGDERPPGMGIKFIKMDPESRALVEQMVSKRGEAPGRFEEGQESDVVASAPAPFFPSTTPESELPPPEDRTQVRHASEFLASALAEGASESASREAEKRAAEARKRTEEIERQRAEAAKQPRKPRIKKTLVGVGVPDDLGVEAPTVEAAPIATSKAAVDATVDDALEKLAAKAVEPESKEERIKPLVDVSESAETKAIDRADLEAARSGLTDLEPPPEDEVAKPATKTADAKAEKADAKAPEKADAKAPEKADAKAPEKADAKAKAEKADAKAKAESSVEIDEAVLAPKAPKEEPKPKAKAEEAPKKAERRPVAQPAAPLEEPRSRMPMIAFAVILVAGVGALVAHQMGLFGGGESPTSQPQIDSQPTDTTPVVDPETNAIVDGEDAADPLDDGEDDEGSGLAVEGDELGADGEPTEGEPTDGEPTEPAVPTMRVQVVTTPPGAAITLAGLEQGTSPIAVELPVGQATTVTARLAGHVEATQEVTAAAGQAPIRLTLQRMPYVIQVVTTPPGAAVRGPGNVTAPGDITLRQPPTGPVGLTASLRGHENATGSVRPDDFVETEGRMVASVTLTLTRAAPPPTPPAGAATPRVRPPRGEEGSAPAGESGGSGRESGDAPAPAPSVAPTPAPSPIPPPAPAPTAPPSDNPFD